MHNFRYKAATSVSDAVVEVNQSAEGQFVAGGTNVLDLMKYFVAKPEVLVDVNPLNSLPVVSEYKEGVRLSAFATNADTAYHPIIEKRYPLLSKAILAGASAQIRNMATNGGNLLQRTRCYYFYDVNTPCNKREPGTGCSAIRGYNRMMAIMGTSEHCIAVFPSDMCVALAALGAVVNTDGMQGKREIPFADFHRLPGDHPEKDNNLLAGELITGIDLPAEGFAEHYAYLKLRDRNSYAFALVSVAVVFRLDGDLISEARIALGGIAHKPWRVLDAELYLQGKSATVDHFAAAAEIILQGAKTFEFNSFKPELARRAIIRCCKMALSPDTQLPGAQPSA
ncbi:xanthine dehydrogenase YagS FAD-binding subunit [Pedobacter duraquae]|uniref:Xanthine dehydrogenase YagS FAD-binding subunit n=2 Tax=Pedobacter duraquae TaxID=425511 RepID=A0A4R6ID80_9SPHI|nr:xanthine dehydrogenase YagS FAD-binding subunit [Pedobacter duraquae]